MNPEEQVESDYLYCMRGGRRVADAEDEDLINEVNRKAEALAYIVKAVVALVTLGLVIYLFIFQGCKQAFAEEIDLNKIAKIESSGCKQMVGDGGESLGCYQISKAALADVNKALKTTYSHRDMMDKKIARTVAGVYINRIIPRYLRHYGIPDNAKNRIIGYNAGLNCLVKNKPIPATTRKYIEKYRRCEVNQ